MSADSIFMEDDSNLMTEIIFTDEEGKYSKNKKLDQVAEFGGYSIGTFRKNQYHAGNGFIIKVLSPVSEVSALAMTAAHTFITNFIYEYETVEFIIGNDIYEALPLKEMLDWDDLSLRYQDPITGVQISVPDDWVICELRKKPNLEYNSELASLEFYRSMDSVAGKKVSLVGFPNQINSDNFDQTCPEASVSNIDELSKCIHEGQNLIETEGIVKNYEKMIAITCVAGNGMSGSPLLIRNDQKYEVIGLLYGGPALPDQFFISEIFNKTDDCVMYFEELKNYLKKRITHVADKRMIELIMCGYKSVKYIKDLYIEESYMCEFSRDILKILYRYAIKHEFELGNYLKYNLCINTMHISINIDSILEKYN